MNSEYCTWIGNISLLADEGTASGSFKFNSEMIATAEKTDIKALTQHFQLLCKPVINPNWNVIVLQEHYTINERF